MNYHNSRIWAFTKNAYVIIRYAQPLIKYFVRKSYCKNTIFDGFLVDICGMKKKECVLVYNIKKPVLTYHKVIE
jgi:hypothetical protein